MFYKWLIANMLIAEIWRVLGASRPDGPELWAEFWQVEFYNVDKASKSFSEIYEKLRVCWNTGPASLTEI